MNSVQKAIWLVESRLRDPITLEEIASQAGVSPFHLTRAFGAITGYPLIRYVRARRLSQAAKALAQGAPDILSIALDAGYGSHEAFTRAFRDQFRLTPEQIREEGCVANVSLVEPVTIDSEPCATISEVRFETAGPFLLAGLSERYGCDTSGGIPSQWQRFHCSPNITNRVGRTAYGVMHNHDDEGYFDYLCGVEVSGFFAIPKGFRTLRVPAHSYAVFRQRDHIATIRPTFSAIWEKWLPEFGREPADAPIVERYGPEFEPHTGFGGFEILIPIRT